MGEGTTVTTRSALLMTVVERFAVLLVVTGSAVGLVTPAVVLIVGTAAGSVVPTNVSVAVPPAGSVPMFEVSVLEAEPVPAVRMGVAPSDEPNETSVMPVGSTLLRTTPVASFGPALLTVIVYVWFWP